MIPYDFLRKRPVPQDFGLTDNQIQRIKAEHSAYIAAKDLMPQLKWALILSPIAATIVAFKSFQSFAFEALLAWIGVAFASWYCLFLLSSLACAVFESFKGKFLPIPIIKQEYELIQKYECALNEWHRGEERRKVEFWLKMGSWSFEVEIATLFRKQGFDAHVTPGSNDGGIDIVLKKGVEKTVVQCKQHKKPLPPSFSTVKF